jgi:hypothetical protein
LLPQCLQRDLRFWRLPKSHATAWGALSLRTIAFNRCRQLPVAIGRSWSGLERAGLGPTDRPNPVCGCQWNSVVGQRSNPRGQGFGDFHHSTRSVPSYSSRNLAESVRPGASKGNRAAHPQKEKFCQGDRRAVALAECFPARSCATRTASPTIGAASFRQMRSDHAASGRSSRR